MQSMLQYSGIAASIWLIIGVYVASLFYPQYSHTRQFCSELGATGSPTHTLSPLINNYPLGLLFTLFGAYVISVSDGSLAYLSIGILVIVHGVSTWGCGLFAMDSDPYTEHPTLRCTIHSYCGALMLLSLLIAPSIVALSSEFTSLMRGFSLLCVCACLYFCYRLHLAFKARTYPGLYQRLSYGWQILWLVAFSFYITD
ncbi:DUF998 domain-containing protein [Pseudoalteromonas sp. CO325X]|uniref:DUF998 domain-containing protein n=1 Tax=Pseudoalteromonas sp. CO325X TaxID=1777262 RepID=UPI001022B0CD|nr:DUF998 domain-containing protein [Pseudoalteromonas sp. CO325X]RZF80153.1 DUF998 domain-containing protein [Pseudoalteromonas sp. CO325X]